MGSVLTKEDFIKGQDHNFNFFVSPGIVDEVLEINNLLYIPGAETVSEFIYLYKKGYKIIKFFPANLNGEQKKLQSIENILKDIKFIPTGGITNENVLSYLALDNVMAVGASALISPDLVNSKSWSEIKKNLKESKELITKS